METLGEGFWAQTEGTYAVFSLVRIIIPLLIVVIMIIFALGSLGEGSLGIGGLVMCGVCIVIGLGFLASSLTTISSGSVSLSWFQTNTSSRIISTGDGSSSLLISVEE